MNNRKIPIAAVVTTVVCGGAAVSLLVSGSPGRRTIVLAAILGGWALMAVGVVVKASFKFREEPSAQLSAIGPLPSKEYAKGGSAVTYQPYYPARSYGEKHEPRVTGQPPDEVTRNASQRDEGSSRALQRVGDEISALRNEIVLLKRLMDDRSHGLEEGMRAVYESVSRSQDFPPPTLAIAPSANLRDSDSSAGEDTIQERLQELAVRCMSRGLSIRRVRDELPPDWLVEASEPNDIPDAFLISPARNHDLWVVPNTREWLPFRDRGWFEVVGTNVVTARIARIDRLPRLTPSRAIRTRGFIEVTT